MRIIKGSHQRRLIHVPAGLPVRPTTDMAKESLFNILSNEIDFEGLAALDLFSGTGSIAYEMASRGCGKIVAVDQHPKCTQFITETAKLLQMSSLQVIRADVFRFLKSLSSPFDLIFADPPYDLPKEQYDEMLSTVLEKNLLKEEGILVLEHSKNIRFIDHPNIFDTRRYGKVHFSFFGKEPL